jgi:hypothetical protein
MEWNSPGHKVAFEQEVQDVLRLQITGAATHLRAAAAGRRNRSCMAVFRRL